jgi:hypothetical protein
MHARAQARKSMAATAAAAITVTGTILPIKDRNGDQIPRPTWIGFAPKLGNFADSILSRMRDSCGGDCDPEMAASGWTFGGSSSFGASVGYASGEEGHIHLNDPSGSDVGFWYMMLGGGASELVFKIPFTVTAASSSALSTGKVYVTQSFGDGDFRRDDLSGMATIQPPPVSMCPRRSLSSLIKAQSAARFLPPVPPHSRRQNSPESRHRIARSRSHATPCKRNQRVAACLRSISKSG